MSGPKTNYKHFTFIGTSGSLDYLKDSTGNQPFWPVHPSSTVSVKPLTPEERGLLDKLLTLTAGHPDPKHDPSCDGIHDTSAPPLHLCTRCFPYERDVQRALDPSEDAEDDEAPQDEGQEHQETPCPS
jgi:hypothetical protein